MRKTFLVMGGAVLCASVVSPKFAHANLLTNGDLEVTSGQLLADPTLLSSDNLIYASSTVHSDALTGWTIGGASIDVIPTSYWTSATGSYSVDLIGTPGLGSISQTVTGLTSGTAYTLTFDFAVNPENFDLEAGSTKILQVTASNSDLSPTTFSATAGSATDLNMNWIAESVTFTASATSVTLTMAALMPTGLPGTFTVANTYCGPAIDNLDLEASGGNPQTPEPASLGILAIGGLSLLRRRSNRAR